MEELKKIAKERHDRNIIQELEAKENITQERELKEIKEKYERPKKVPIYQMLMDARLDFYRVEQKMNCIRQQAEEVIFAELIYN